VLSVQFELNPVLAVAAGGAVALLASFMLSLPSLRISGDYLLITSIGFQLGLIEIIKNLDFVGGASGLSGIPNIVVEHRSLVFAAVSLSLAVASVLLVRWLVRGPYGRAIQAMRDDELAFSALGRNAMNIKMTIFALGSGMAGVAGGIYAYYYQYLTPDQFQILQSAMILTMVVVGGMGNVFGAAWAALFLALLRAFSILVIPSAWQGLILYALLFITILLFPNGVKLRLPRRPGPALATVPAASA
jgi:branched-chain amino acid transport system permease protein